MKTLWSAWGVLLPIFPAVFLYTSPLKAQTCTVVPPSGPHAGGNTVLVTNAVPAIGNGLDITSIVIDGIPATFMKQGSNWVWITVPVAVTDGTKDIVIQSASAGEITFAAAYTVNPKGEIGGVVKDWTQWQVVAGLPAPRRCLAAAVLNGALYAIGGEDAGVIRTNVYRYDGTAWTEVEGLPQPRCDLAAAVLNGALYAIGGSDATAVHRTVYRYDGSNWSQAAELPSTKSRLAAGVLNGALYAIGGQDWVVPIAQTNVYRYDGTNWTEVAGLPYPRLWLAAATLDGALYAVGGMQTPMNARPEVYRYDGSRWTRQADSPRGRWGLAAAVFNGAMYVVGGEDSRETRNTYRYDGTHWTAEADLPALRVWLAAAVLNNSLYAIGGVGVGTVATTNVYRYPHETIDPGVTPSNGTCTGGYQLCISGSNMGDGIDVTNVTICGVTAASIDSQSATTITVTVAPGTPGPGDVIVRSTSFGTSIKSNAYLYDPVITVTVGQHGTVEPSGVVDVRYGGTTNFAVNAEQYYHIHHLLTNNAELVAATNQTTYTFDWNNVRSISELTVNFVEDLTTNTQTPHWWLATHGWKEDFDGAATNDVDADGMPTWTEYLAGTDPTNRASFLGFDNVAQNSTGTGVVLRWHSVNGKFYRIERGTNLMAIQCFDTLVQTNILGIAPLNEETDKTAVGHGPHFYRITLE